MNTETMLHPVTNRSGWQEVDTIYIPINSLDLSVNSNLDISKRPPPERELGELEDDYLDAVTREVMPSQTYSVVHGQSYEPARVENVGRDSYDRRHMLAWAELFSKGTFSGKKVDEARTWLRNFNEESRRKYGADWDKVINKNIQW